MSQMPIVYKIDRENLSDWIGANSAHPRNLMTYDEISGAGLARNEIFVGYWLELYNDPFPDFIIASDNQYDDTLAWLNAFLPGLSPLTQATRVWRLSDFLALETLSKPPRREIRLGAWVGAMLAEFSLNNPQNILKEASTVGLQGIPTYAAARAISVWGRFSSFDELLRRHEIVRRKEVRLPPREFYSSLWYTLAGDQWLSKPPADSNAFTVMRQLVDQLPYSRRIDAAEILDAAKFVAYHFDLPEIERCVVGPQGQRVEALDRLAERASAGPRGGNADALIGFGASLIDPGAAVLPELLRRHHSTFPFAAIWAGAFAGIWSPVRVLSDHAGLGRLLAKQLAARHDLFEKPSADIAVEEFQRWTGGNLGSAFAIRGALPRNLTVELFPGVTVTIPALRDSGRPDAAIQGGVRQQSLDLPEGGKVGNFSHSPEEKPKRSELAIIHDRLNALERALSAISTKASSSRAAGARSSKKPT